MAQDVLEQPHLHALQIVRELQPWHDYLAGMVGSEHGNATLQLLDLTRVMLAAFFSPLVRSQRLIEALTSQQWMQASLDIGRIPRATLSDAFKRFDPEELRPLIAQLVRQVPALQRRDADLASVTRQVLAADGSYFALAGEVAWAICTKRNPDGTKVYGARLNLQLDVRTFAPVDCDVSGGLDACEPRAVMRRLKPGVIYVVDRNFFSFEFMNAVLALDSNLVLRLKKNVGFETQQTCPLTQMDRDLGVREDGVGHLSGPRSKGNGDARSCTDRPPRQLLRRVVVWDERNQVEVVLLTDLLEIPAWVVAELYRRRWQIELFFKWLKSWANFDHAFCKHASGLTLQFYIAVIGTLLLHLATGRQVNKYSLFWLSCVAHGRASWREMQEGLERIEREKELERARRSRKKLAAKTNG